MPHLADAIIITCIDFRIQEYIDNWFKQNFKKYLFDRVALAGGVFDFYSILKQVEISHRLHQTKKVILVNHEDCGVYGVESTPERHSADLKKAKAEILKIYPDLAVDLYYLHLNGEFERVE